MIKLYLKKLIWMMVYVAFWFAIFCVMALFLNPFLSPALILILSFIGVFAFITTYTVRNRYPDGELRRAYLAETESFSLKTEIIKVLRSDHFICEVWTYITFSVVLAITAILSVEIITAFIMLRVFIRVIFLFAIPFTIINMFFWLLIRYRWYKDRKDLLSGKHKKRTYVIN